MPRAHRWRSSWGGFGLSLAVLGVVNTSCADETTEPDPPPPDPVAPIVVTPTTATLVVGDTTRIVAVVKSAAGVVLTDRSLQWTSSEPTTTSGSSTGLVTGVAIGGPVPITVVSEGKTATAQVTVTRVPVALIELTPTDTTLVTGTTVQLASKLRSATGQLLTDRGMARTSNSPAVASVSQMGLVTAVAAGGR